MPSVLKSTEFILTARFEDPKSEQSISFFALLAAMAAENITFGTRIKVWEPNEEGVGLIWGNAPGARFDAYMQAIPALMDLHEMPQKYTVVVKTIREGSFGYTIDRSGIARFVRKAK